MRKSKKKSPQKKTKSKFKKFVDFEVARILAVMSLEWWEVKIFYESKDENYNENRLVHMRIDVIPQYHTADLFIFPVAFRNWKRAKIHTKKALCHELAHLHTQPCHNKAIERHVMRTEIDEKHEELTEIIGKYIYDLTY